MSRQTDNLWSSIGFVTDSKGGYKELERAIKKLKRENATDIMHLGGFFETGTTDSDIKTIKILRGQGIGALKSVSDYRIADQLVKEWNSNRNYLSRFGYDQGDIDFIYALGTHLPGSEGLLLSHSSITYPSVSTIENDQDANKEVSDITEYNRKATRNIGLRQVNIYVRGDSRMNLVVSKNGIVQVSEEHGFSTSAARNLPA